MVHGSGLMVHDSRYDKKADRIMEYVLECGNFGHNRQRLLPNSFLGGKIISVWRKMKDFGQHARVFPLDSIKFFFHFIGDGLQLASEQR